MKKKAGFTLVEIMIVVAIIGLLAAIAIPSFVKARNTARANACVNNLRQIDGAKEQLALAENLGTGETIDDTAYETNMLSYLKETPECPAGGDYTYGDIGADPTCSYVDTDENHAL
jgi:prepilin-type N-terminal cleavage/methylation domain-containing protein